jgi:uncharacterized repeat protein (TIGR03803 family)
MRPNRLSLQFTAALAILGLVLFATNARAASHQILHSFNPNGADAAYSYAGLVTDGVGNRYGTTYYGGTDNVGTVFELSPNGSGWTEKVLYSFSSNGNHGTYPEGGLVLDGAGNLYGTTTFGGIHGGGTMFELSPNGSGGWTETVLHSFGGGTDGGSPYASLIFDGAGNLYGTTQGGGLYFGGTVFEFSPRQGGGWTETVLHNFNPDNGTDGYDPQASLIRDAAGNLYGTTSSGGIHFWGTAFELSPRQGGGWTETVLHSFNDNGTDANQPKAALILDGTGNLYGTTFSGGIHNLGAVFELAPNGSGGWTETVLHSFGNGTDGAEPVGGLILDGSGNLFGTTSEGGIHTFGAVFELSPRQGGGWTEAVLHSFNVNGTDGAFPDAGLILDAGNLYGTTGGGGTGSVGTIFELSPRQGGGWTEAVLYSFNFDGTDGATPVFANLVSDSAGNFYGTTVEGGTYDSGTAFELTPNGGGGWTEKVLYNFGKNTDASIPYAGLIFDNVGNLYGTTVTGGIHGWGTVFELTPTGGGWTEKVLHSFNFNGSDGAEPFGGLVFDAFGNLYGTTYVGGIHGNGTVFELSPNGSGGWTEKVLHSFNFNGSDGAQPWAGLVIDAAGNLYGTTNEGGIYYIGGTVFELSPNGSGGWTEKILHSFNFNGVDGANPFDNLIFDAANNLYGTTQQGGIHGNGTVFQLTPHQNGSWTERVLHSFNGTDGSGPDAGLVRFGSLSDLYGTTSYGGVNGAGTVFELTPTQGGNWIETVLHNFSLVGGDGNEPEGSLIFDPSGNLYGMTELGGTYNSGAVFEITP